MLTVRFLLLLCFLLFIQCGQSDVPPPEFDGARAFQHLVDQVNFGPRVPGTQASKNCREYFKQYFDSLGFAVDSQATTFWDPYSSVDTPLVNLIVNITGEKDGPPILIAAHYDSRPRADYAYDSTRLNMPIDGANDGASGTAVLMELGRMCAQKKPPYNVTLLFLDAEDWGKSGDPDLYLLGSKEFARLGVRGKYRFGIVIDMIGDASQQIYKEEFSQMYSPDLNNMIWKTAADLGVTTFVDSVKHTVLDDHISFSAGGIPTVVLIDFDYPYWHTELDQPAQCSPESLTNVGRVLTKVVYSPSLWPKMK